ncbi:MAG: glycosyltransferase family 2 protein [Acidobacteria bacterium]|nr:glycosyltransferase family 2 protein [Acidobacteriota bacterium]
MMKSPSVSVILPTYNRAHLLARAVRSVLDQSYTDLELVVVDDCSTDTTMHELSMITDSRLKVIRQQINSGPSAARNAGIRTATGRYIAFQDSDAEWKAGKLMKQIALMELADGFGVPPAACYSRFILSRREETITMPSDKCTELSGDIYARLLNSNTMDTPAMVIRKDVLDQVGYFDESMVNLEDWDLALRLSSNHPIAFLDEATLISYDSPNSVNKRIAPESLLTILRKHSAAYQAHPRAFADITWRIGCEYALRRERSAALHYMHLSISQRSTSARRVQFASLRAGMSFYVALLYARKLVNR